MKSNSRDEEVPNLVMFPSSKNFKVTLSAIETQNDPLAELINEYAHVKESDIPDYLDDRFEINLEENFEGECFDSLEAFMNRNQLQEVQTPDDKLVALINERMEAIMEARARIKYYLDEIEMFLPSRRK